jgi:hypothetical protein
MRKLIPFVVTMSLSLWWADASQTGDKIVTVAPAAAVSLPKPLAGDRAIRADIIFQQANAIVAHGTGRRAS